MNCAQTLIVDLAPDHGSAITACVSSLYPTLFSRLLSDPHRNSVEQPRPMLFWSSLRLSHRPHSEPLTTGVDVRPHYGHLLRVLPHTFCLASLRTRVASEATGTAAGFRGNFYKVVEDSHDPTMTKNTNARSRYEPYSLSHPHTRCRFCFAYSSRMYIISHDIAQDVILSEPARAETLNLKNTLSRSTVDNELL